MVPDPSDPLCCQVPQCIPIPGTNGYPTQGPTDKPQIYTNAPHYQVTGTGTLPPVTPGPTPAPVPGQTTLAPTPKPSKSLSLYIYIYLSLDLSVTFFLSSSLSEIEVNICVNTTLISEMSLPLT